MCAGCRMTNKNPARDISAGAVRSETLPWVKERLAASLAVSMWLITLAFAYASFLLLGCTHYNVFKDFM